MKKDLSPGWNIPAIIPTVNLGVSVDTYYNFKKFYSPGFTWSFDIHHSELYQVEQDLLDFLAKQTEKKQLGRIMVKLSCQKLGTVTSVEFSIEYVKKVDQGWSFGDTY